MEFEAAVITLVGITLFAAVVNGALGYGFSSLTVPVALLFYSGRVLSPALVLVEVALNAYVLLVNRESFGRVWRRTLPILIGLVPGIAVGSYLLSHVDPGVMKLVTYLVLLPLILLQAAGIRRYIQGEAVVALPLGFGVGTLYSITTISGPPLAIMFNNQGFEKEDFRAGLGLVRVVESSLTAVAYAFLGLFAAPSLELLPLIVPSIVVGLPLGAFVIRRMNHETFRRICMSFDAWVVGFGLSRVLAELNLVPAPLAYVALALTASIDIWLLFRFFRERLGTPRRVAMSSAVAVVADAER